MNGPKLFGYLFGLPVSETLVNTWITMAIAFVMCFVLTRNLKKHPGKAQVIGEGIVTAIDNLVGSTMGKDKMKFAPYILSLMMFLIFANTCGLYGLRSPTGDISFPLTLALITFVLIEVYTWKGRGPKGYFKEYIEPYPFMLPINIIEKFSRPVSMTFRIFGNLVGGIIIMLLAYEGLSGLTYLALIIPIPLHFYFDLFVGCIQAFIFSMLTMVFIARGMDD
ncbi:F0F1 ATP synthase subunit A [Acetobacterium paludosum]|uniref:ATP synthase subunit a n=1 Tax=Acetobacterium paludosum TaxID=52693 RepID=A0A923KTC3_9FIRM|nr:F0F1 ATP synthase subunit A [Acetobacterium paludosum]MBC3889267.1 F0F1 ATP synthase subunit A [Acetobacterium paludosum]